MWDDVKGLFIYPENLYPALFKDASLLELLLISRLQKSIPLEEIRALEGQIP